MVPPGASDPRHIRRQRRALIGLALLFFAPLAWPSFCITERLASGWPRESRRTDRSAAAVTRGGAAAVDPKDPAAQSLTSPRFLARKWTLLYWGAGTCSERCKVDLYDTRQVRIALNRDMDRVQRVFVAQGECCDFAFLREQHPDLITVRATPEAAPHPRPAAARPE